MNFSYSLRPVFASTLFSALCYPNAMAATPVAAAEIENAPQAEKQNAALRDAATKPRFNPELQISSQCTDVTVQTVGINQTLCSV